MSTKSGVYVPIESTSPIARTLAALIALFPAKNPDGTRREPAETVASTWGRHPDMRGRHLVAQGPRGVLMIGAVALFIVAMGLYVLGGQLGQPAIRALASVPAVLAAFSIGLSGPLGTRALAGDIDHARWLAAGCPSQWTPSVGSQPRNRDLVIGAAIGVVVAALWLGLMYAPR